MVRILTLGAKQLDYNRKIDITEISLNKPVVTNNCLWGSTMIKLPGGKITSSWKNWVYCNYDGMDYKYGISFKLHRNSKILEIASMDDYINIMEKYKIKNVYSDKYSLDFVKISKEYDAFHITEDAFWKLRMPMDSDFYKLKYEDFYSYDAESWIIFNLDSINRGSTLYHNNIVAGYEGDY